MSNISWNWFVESQNVVGFGIYNNLQQKLENVNKDFQVLSAGHVDWINDEVSKSEEKFCINLIST